jgi:putative GTP pyrophosphokinase
MRTVLEDVPDELRHMARFLLVYKFAIDEITTKLEILREEFSLAHEYNPIEHVTSRVKTPEGILQKAMRKGVDLDLGSIRDDIRDIAGVRVVCSFVTDVYWVLDMLCRQTDVDLVELEDYIADPKPNGYRSLHAIVRIPVFLSTGVEHVPVELQVRTVAQDFWASLEHKIFYKHEGRVPAGLVEELQEAAAGAAALDMRMQELHRSVQD